MKPACIIAMVALLAGAGYFALQGHIIVAALLVLCDLLPGYFLLRELEKGETPDSPFLTHSRMRAIGYTIMALGLACGVLGGYLMYQEQNHQSYTIHPLLFASPSLLILGGGLVSGQKK